MTQLSSKFDFEDLDESKNSELKTLPNAFDDTRDEISFTKSLIISLGILLKILSYKFLPFIYTSFSGEFTYLGKELSSTLPPKATDLSLISNIGNISLEKNLSYIFPFAFSTIVPLFKMSDLLKPFDIK